MPVENIDEAMRLIENWMAGRRLTTAIPKEGVEFKEVLSFAYSCKTPTGLGLAIVQPKNTARTILVASRVDIAKQHLDVLGSMDVSEFEDFILELRMALVLAPTMFQILPLQGMPNSIQLSLEISFDELTEGRLNSALSNITKTSVLIVLLFRKKFGLQIIGESEK